MIRQLISLLIEEWEPMRASMRADALRNEAAFLPASVEDLAELRRQIIGAGYPASVANGLIGWLVSKAAGERDVSSSETRSRYRRILAELVAEGGPGGGQDEPPPRRPLGGELVTAHNPRFGRSLKLVGLAA